MIAQNGTTITPLSTSPKEMCYSEGFHDFKAAILALHQTPPVAVGLQEPGAYAAYNASMKAWRHAAIQPLCDMLAESDTEHLAPQFGIGLTVEIESDTVDDLDLIEQQLQNDLAAKVRTKNEWRAVRGMPPLPGADGNSLVGTDTAPPAPPPTSDELQPQRPADSNPIENLETTPPASPDLNNSAGSSGNSSNTKSAVTSPREQQHPQTSPPDDSNSTALGQNESADTDDDRIELIADILYGLFGNSALSYFDLDCQTQEKAFDPELHPRDERGRFTQRGSAEAGAAARQIVAEILRGGIALENDSRIIGALHLLSRKQLESLHREHGITPQPSTRRLLTESIRARLFPSPFTAATDNSKPSEGDVSVHHGIKVFVQHENELHQRLGRQIRREQWSGLIGAQPGARVHVYPVATRNVGISVEHLDYRAKRTIYHDSIYNLSFEITPEKQGQGIGARVLAEQVRTASLLKFKYLEVDAGGVGTELRASSHDEQSGFYAWARLGYDGRIAPLLRERTQNGTPAEIATVADFRSQFPGVKYVSEMMLTEERRTWWRKYGGRFTGRFGLSKQSKQRLILEAYLSERGHASSEPQGKSLSLGTQTSGIKDWAVDEFRCEPPKRHSTEGDPVAVNDEAGEFPDRLTEEEETLLDRIWDRIGQAAGITTDASSP